MAECCLNCSISILHEGEVVDMMFPMLAIVLLVVALGSIVLYQRASHELTRVLTAGSAIVCLIWGFAIAHWSIHLLCLILLLKFKSPAIILKAVQIDNK